MAGDHAVSTDSFTFLNEKEELERLSGASCLIFQSRQYANCDIMFFRYGAFQVGITTTKRGDRLIIHVMDVDVPEERGKGYGTKVLQALLTVVKNHNLVVIAQEVLKPSERFLLKNGLGYED